MHKEPVKFRIIPGQKLIKLALEFEDSGGLKVEVVESDKEKNRIVMILVFFPISLKKDVGSLGNIAVLGTVVLIYLIIVRLVVIKLFLGDYDRNSIFFQRLSKKL